MASNQEGKGILVLGLGELGLAMVDAFLSHASYSAETSPLSVMIRPTTITAPSAEKAAQLAGLEARNVNIVGGDLEAGSLPELITLFSPYHTVIHAGAMTQKPGTMLKITQAVLKTGTNRLYIPWQFGVDYDVITRNGGQGMFTEQLDVRDLLRAQAEVQWLIVGCGVFMSFLFEDFWGVIARDESGKIVKVRALGSWDDLLTATTAEDIGTCTADLVIGDSRRNQTIYIAGDTLKYGEFAGAVEKVVGPGIERELWSTEHLRRESEADPTDKLKKYRVVFSEGRGLAWPKENSYNIEKGIHMTGFQQYLANHV